MTEPIDGLERYASNPGNLSRVHVLQELGEFVACKHAQV